ncbi:hypothetical protein [Microbulbifer variabilis]|uniref:hypothetical protein n=1 Tax=Microbulbifer variabilis TaxID=266805 RepID=UPI001CFEDA89|nr:hypothetical protein [Microbulbifer variabilis]
MFRNIIKLKRAMVGSLCFFAFGSAAVHAATIIPGCENYSSDTGVIYVKDSPSRTVVGRSAKFVSQSPWLVHWGHKTTFKLAHLDSSNRTVITAERDSDIDEEGESDLHLTPTYRGWNWVAVIDKSDKKCDNERFLAINGPTVSVSKNNESTSGNWKNGDFLISGTMDQTYAINAKAGLPMKFQVQRKTIAQWTGTRCDVVEETATWENFGSLSNLSSYNYSERCDAHYRFRSYDGEFFSNWKSLIVQGGSTGSTGGGTGGDTGGGGGGSCSGRICDIEP